jgi:hypothetical protein
LKAQINFLKLVYPPISNQEAEWMKDDPEVIEELKKSNLYMIVQRHESKFHLFNENEMSENFIDNFSIKFKYTVGDISDDVEINLTILFKELNINIDKYNFEFELGKKLIRIWKCDLETNERIDVVDWFTTEKILWDKWREHPAIFGLDNYREFSNYYLHYVGISKKDDSWKRLVIKPHDKRLRILSNENSIASQSRLTDELILLFFKIEPLEIQVYDEKNTDDFLYGMNIDNKKIIADAEKAFIQVLDSKYNAVKYKNYPKGEDGLYNEGLTRYGYIVGESMTLTTDKEEVRGDALSKYTFYESADMIMIEDDEVTIVKHECNNLS